VSGDRPRVTVALLRELLDDDFHVDPVLYLERENMRLEIWTSTQVNPDERVVSRAELIEWYGHPIPDETLEETLAHVQETIDLI
jgi:hypothetical protein